MLPSYTRKGVVHGQHGLASPRNLLVGFVSALVLVLLWISLRQAEKVSAAVTSSAAATMLEGLPIGKRVDQLVEAVTLLRKEVAVAAGETRQPKEVEAAAALPPPVVAAQHVATIPAPSKPRKYAIVGLAKGIDAELLYRFARSARNHMPVSRVDLVLFLHKDDAPKGSDLEAVLKSFGVTVKTFDPSTFKDAKHRNYHPSSYRWMLIRDWMATAASASSSSSPSSSSQEQEQEQQQQQQPYAGVFMTDVRDVVFQSDVFADMEKKGDKAEEETEKEKEAFYAFLEARPGTIASCGWNSGWVKDCFGQAGLNLVGGHIISCSGTSLATWKSARLYAGMMGDEMSSNACERNGADQGVHNYFVYSGKLEASLKEIGSSLVLVDNEDGFVGTVQSMRMLNRDRYGRLVNDKAKPYAVVHQYDRSPVLVEQYKAENTWLQQEQMSIAK